MLATVDEDNSLDDLLERCSEKNMVLASATKEAIDDIFEWLAKAQPVFRYLRQKCDNMNEEVGAGADRIRLT